MQKPQELIIVIAPTVHMVQHSNQVVKVGGATMMGGGKDLLT